MVLDGGLGFDAAHSYRRMKEKKLRAMMARVELIGDESLFQPAIPRPAIVEVATSSGETLREHVTSSSGTPDNPMSDEEVERKGLDLIAPVLGDARSRELVDKVRALDRVSSVREIAGLLRKK
jgi:2-methylcitrate dehydratase PrpD